MVRVVGKVGQRPIHALSGIVWGGVIRRLAKTRLAVGQCGNDLLDVTLPNPLGPLGIDAVATDRLRSTPCITEGMDQIGDRCSLREG